MSQMISLSCMPFINTLPTLYFDKDLSLNISRSKLKAGKEFDTRDPMCGYFRTSVESMVAYYMLAVLLLTRIPSFFSR